VLNHLCARALQNYAANLAAAFQPAMELGAPSALFCDSWELDSRGIWSEPLWDVFAARFQYDLRPYAGTGTMPPGVRYDYLKFLDIVVRESFYREFTAITRRMGGFSRVQVHGSPTDPIAGYAEADIPETEALLYEPRFSRIAASAAAMSGKAIVSCEAFTCMYGFPDRHLEHEDVRDLKLLADALLAEGVNHFVWHGMPYQPGVQTQRFYATCHVGPDGALAAHTRSLNRYLTNACEMMRKGQPYSQLAVYLPREDEIMKGEFHQSDWRVPGENYRWEMRRARLPEEFAGYNPLWISEAFLRAARAVEGRVRAGPMEFEAICVDAEWLDYDSLVELVRLSSEGATIVLPSHPRQPGRNRTGDYAGLLGRLRKAALGSMQELDAQPLVDGPHVPPFFARRDEVNTYLFFAHPAARLIEYPMHRGQAAETAKSMRRRITIRMSGHQVGLELPFDDLESIVVTVNCRAETTLVKQGLRCA
jgi:hypothetical protein